MNPALMAIAERLADAYQLAGAVLTEIPDDPRHAQLLDELDALTRDIEDLARTIGTRWLTLEEAARESGRAAGTLRVHLNAGRLKGEKRGRDWYVDATDLQAYLRSLSKRGRPPKSGAGRGGQPR